MSSSDNRLPIDRPSQEVGRVGIMRLRSAQTLELFARTQLPLLNICPAGKRAPAAAQYRNIRGRVDVEPSQHFGQAPDLIVVEGVELVRTIESDSGNTAGTVIENGVSPAVFGHFYLLARPYRPIKGFRLSLASARNLACKGSRPRTDAV